MKVPVCLWTRTWFMSFHLILKSSVLVLPTALYMGSHPIRVVTFFSTENTPTHPPWLCFNALQVYLLQHLESLNRHTALSSVYRHTHTHTHKNAVKFAHQETFLLAISTTSSVGARICVPAKVSILLHSLDWKKEGLLEFANKQIVLV